MKKRTKEENAAYSRMLRAKQKALKESLQPPPVIQDAATVTPEIVAPEIVAPPNDFNDTLISEQYTRVQLTPEAVLPCAECAGLRDEVCNLNKEKDTLVLIWEGRINGLNAVIKDQAAEIIELRQTIASLKSEAETVRPPAAPVKAGIGADDKALFNRIMEAKINRFGRNASIGSVR